MPLTIRAHSGGGRGVIRLEGVEDSADAEKVKFLLQADDSGKAIGFTMATWDIYLCDFDGNKLQPEVPLADRAAVAPWAPSTTVNVFVQLKPGMGESQGDGQLG
jgi:hypothetical protein